MFHTPPINPERPWADEAAKESYMPDQQQAITQTPKKINDGIMDGTDEDVFDEKVYLEKHLKEKGDTLPSELQTLVERFYVSLQEPRYEKPLMPEDIVILYQRFYKTFHERNQRFVYGTFQKTHTQQLMSQEEIKLKKREKNELKMKIIIYDEISEKQVCFKSYNKIFKPNLGNDLILNNLLTNKIQILKKLKISLKQLEVNELNDEIILKNLKNSSETLKKINDFKNPLEKLELLLLAHKQIIEDVFNKLGIKDASADLILPVLIFCFIYFDIPNLWLNFLFIKRYRKESSLNGEHLFVLTNYEAVCSFLESITLKSLGIEYNEEDDKYGELLLVKEPLKKLLPVPIEKPNQGPESFIKNKRINSSTDFTKTFNLLHPTELALTAAASADQGLRAIGNTVESFNKLFGRLTNSNSNSNSNANSNAQQQSTSVNYPKTLSEVKKIVGVNESLPTSPSSSSSQSESLNPLNRIPNLGIIRSLRSNNSNDSVLSNERNRSRSSSINSLQNILSISTRNRSNSNLKPPIPTPSTSVSSAGNGFHSHSSRNASFSQQSLSELEAESETETEGVGASAGGNTSGTGGLSDPLHAALGNNGSSNDLPLSSSSTNGSGFLSVFTNSRTRSRTQSQTRTRSLQTAPRRPAKMPIERFEGCEDVSQLTLGDVAALLQDYKRLAGIVRDLT